MTIKQPIETNNGGYSTEYFNRIRQTRLLKLVLKTGAITLVTVVVFRYIAIQYFVNLPHERRDLKLSFQETLYSGIYQSYIVVKNFLTTPEVDFKMSKLPKVELFIRQSRIASLNSNLPYSGRVEKTAYLKVDKKIHKVKARYRGDSVNHWAYPVKSWRIIMPKGEFYQGMREFNLYQPRFQNQISDNLGYFMAHKFPGLVAPRAFPVHFRLNRKFNGMRVLIEQVNENFLPANNLPASKLYIGDINTEQIYTSDLRSKLFDTVSTWEVIPPYKTETPVLNDKREIENLINLLKNSPTRDQLKDELPKIIDVDATLKYMALLEIVGSKHIDDSHNHKWFVNPNNGLLTPIAWDTVPFMRRLSTLDLGGNDLFNKILTVPELRERKNKFILEVITSTLSPEKLEEYINDFRKRTELEIIANPYKLQAISMDINFITNDDWRESYEDLMTLATEGIAELKKTLYRNKSSFFVEHLADKKHKNLFLKVFSHAGANLEDIILETNSNSNCNVIISAYSKQNSEKLVFSPDINKSDCNNGKYHYKINKTLYSQRYLDKRIIKKTEGIYKFEIAFPDENFEIKKIRIFAKNSLTGESFELPKEIKDKNIDPKLEIQEIKNQDKHAIINYLSGKNEITSDLVIKENETLVIKANSELILSPNVSIIVNKGKLILEGTPSQPVKIQALNNVETWGTIAIQSGELEITNSIISGGSGKFLISKDSAILSRVYYPSTITANYSKIIIRDSELNSADITLNKTTGTLENCTFVNPPPITIRQNDSNIKTSNIIINKNNTFQINEEYKTFFGKESLDNTEYLVKSGIKEIGLKDLAKKINKLISSLVSNNEKMLLAKLLEGSYYASIAKEKEKGLFDINLDTKDKLLDKNGIKYQIRYSFNKADNPREYLFNPKLVQTWPNTSHFETIISKDNKDKYKNLYDKSIFDISDNSKPFSKDNPAPFQPWNIAEHVGSLKSGLYKNIPLLPAKHVLDSLKILNSTETEISPQNINISKELIQSLNIRSRYSSQLDEVFEIAVVMNERYPYKIIDSLDNKDLRDQKEINYHIRITINKDYLKQLQSAITDINKYNQIVLQLDNDLKFLIKELEGVLRS